MFHHPRSAQPATKLAPSQGKESNRHHCGLNLSVYVLRVRFWIDDYRDPSDHVKDWGKTGDVWYKSYEDFLMNLQFYMIEEKRIEHIYFDYNLGPVETGLDCDRLITSKYWE